MAVVVTVKEKYIYKSLAERVIYQFRLNDSAPSSLEAQIINEICNHIFSLNLKIEELAGFIGINARTLQKCCIEFFGISPKSLIDRVRVEMAQKLLERGKSLGSAVAVVGFSNISHFKAALNRTSSHN